MSRPPRTPLSVSVSLHVSTETVASQIMFTQEARSQPAFVPRTSLQKGQNGTDVRESRRREELVFLSFLSVSPRISPSLFGIRWSSRPFIIEQCVLSHSPGKTDGDGTATPACEIPILILCKSLHPPPLSLKTHTCELFHGLSVQYCASLVAMSV